MDIQTLTKELDRAKSETYQARRKGGIAYKQHMARIKNLERKVRILARAADSKNEIKNIEI